jgi:hypothetical protein
MLLALTMNASRHLLIVLLVPDKRVVRNPRRGGAVDLLSSRRPRALAPWCISRPPSCAACSAGHWRRSDGPRFATTSVIRSDHEAHRGPEPIDDLVAVDRHADVGRPLAQVPCTAFLVALLGEPLTALQIAGGAIVLAGIFVVNRGS